MIHSSCSLTCRAAPPLPLAGVPFLKKCIIIHGSIPATRVSHHGSVMAMGSWPCDHTHISSSSCLFPTLCVLVCREGMEQAGFPGGLQEDPPQPQPHLRELPLLLGGISGTSVTALLGLAHSPVGCHGVGHHFPSPSLILSSCSRYILVDWLVEVATMKDFSSLCLHMTVGCVDRYLKLRPVPRARLQLLGIACMVICTR